MNMSLKTIKIKLQTYMVGNREYDPCKHSSRYNSELEFAEDVEGKHHVFLSINDGEQYVLLDQNCNQQTLVIDECGKISKYCPPRLVCNPNEKKVKELQCKIDGLQDELDCLRRGD